MQPQTGAQRHHGAGDGGIVGIGQDVAHKALVDLELIQRQALEVGQRRVAGAKVVQRERDAVALELEHLLNRVFHILQQQAFGQLQLQFARIGAGVGNGVQHALHKIALVELPGADVDGNAQVCQMGLIGPGHQLCAGGVQHPVAQRDDEAGGLSQRHKFSGGNHAVLRPAPAQQRFTGNDPGMVYLGLEVQLKVLLLQPLAHGCFQLHPRLDAGLHAGRIEMQRIAPRNFGLVHRQVGAFEQLVGTIALALKQRDADAGRAVLRALAQHKGRLEGLQHTPPKGLGQSDGLAHLGGQGFEQDHELVVAMARHHVALLGAAVQPFGHLAQQGITGFMAQGLVDGLEVVDVQHQHGAVIALAAAGNQRLLQVFQHQAPVGQLRQCVVKLQVVDLGFGHFVGGEVLQHHQLATAQQRTRDL